MEAPPFKERFMRVWEFEDNKAAPADLVREQDFILRVRRMQRHGSPSLVLNFALSAIEPLAKNAKDREAVHKKLQAVAQASSGVFYEMSNGDVFIVWERAGDARIMASRSIDNAMPEYAEMADKFLLTYRMPENYALLRERTNYYVDLAHSVAVLRGDTDKVDESSGHLTAKNVDQIDHLLNEIDVRKYGRTQTMYKDKGGVWEPIAEEYFISFEDLRRERFPKVEVVRSEHFFFAICARLDQRLLTLLTDSYDSIAGRRINLNLSIATITGSIFAQFVRRIPKNAREAIAFEIHRADILQDFSLTLSAIEIIRREGFKVFIDSVTPNMTPYVNFEKFPVDGIKVNASKDRVLQFEDPIVRKAVEALPKEKLMFFRCDNEKALTIGRNMGVKFFQGWMVDDLAKGVRKT